MSSTAKLVYKGTKLFRVISSVVGIVLVFLLGLYGAGSVFNEGGFTISLDDTDSVAPIEISLSETSDFNAPSVRLSVPGVENMTNITETDIPTDLATLDGSNNGAHYIAYTFYVKNVGNTPCNLKETFHLNSSAKQADEAIRIKVIKNGSVTTYAKLGQNGVAEYGTTPFESEDTVYESVNENFNPGDVIKYTLVIWIEGNDPECLDNIKGGNVEMSITYSSYASGDQEKS